MSWWIIWQPDAPSGQPNYTLFQGTQSQADAQALNIVNGKADGPYNTQADAKNAVTSGAVTPPSGAPKGGLGGVATGSPSNPFAGIADVAHALAGIGAFFTDAWKMITNWRMWASLGWVVLGILLIGIGIVMWVGKEALPLAGKFL